LAALVRRSTTGRGASIDVSLAETVLGWQGVVLTGARRAPGEVARGRGLLNGGAACYQIYETFDGRFVALGALEQKFWANFCQALGRPEWISRQSDPLPQDDLIAEVAAAIRGATRDAWVARLAEIDCCFQPVLEPDEVPLDPQVAARGLIQLIGDADPRVEVMFPAVFDGRAPAQREPLREGRAENVLAAWSRRA